MTINEPRETLNLWSARGLLGPLWVACATAFYVFQGPVARLFGDPPFAWKSAAGVVVALAPFVFVALGVLGTRRLWTGRGAGWPLVATAMAPAATGVVIGALALARQTPASFVGAPDTVAWQLVVEAASAAAMRGLAASACALLIVQVASACAYRAALVRRGIVTSWANAGVGRGVATACVHALLLLPLLPALGSAFTRSFWDAIPGMAHAEEVERGWAWMTAGALAVAAMSSTLLATSSPMLGWIGRDDERAALWRHAMTAAASGSLAALFVLTASNMSELRPFGEPLGGSIGTESVPTVLFQCLLAAGVFLAGAWSFWKPRPAGRGRGFMAWAPPVAFGCAAAAPVALAHELAGASGRLDAGVAPSFPCVVVVRDSEVVDPRQKHPIVEVTLEISNEMADDLVVDGADAPSWQVAGSPRVPAHGSSTIWLSREVRYADLQSPIQARIHVHAGGRQGVLGMPPVVLPTDPELRKRLGSGQADWNFINNP